MEEKINKIEKDLSLIKDRNQKVEADKAWEISAIRIITISIITYIVASVVLYFVGVDTYLLSAFIPTIGYVISTQSLPFIKKWWIKEYIRNQKLRS